MLAHSRGVRRYEAVRPVNGDPRAPASAPLFFNRYLAVRSRAASKVSRSYESSYLTPST